MSWYVDYYVGYKTKEGKIYPLGHFDCFGNLRPVLTKSRSFASNLWERFQRVTLAETTEELKKHFPDGDLFSWGGSSEEKEEQAPWCFWLDVDDLPTGSYLKKGYFLQEDIAQYERSLTDEDVYFDGFYEMLTPAEYVRKMESELKFGIPKPKKDCEGNEFEVYSCGEYSYYVYPDYSCQEYEASVIRDAVNVYEYMIDLPEGSKLVVLQTNG